MIEEAWAESGGARIHYLRSGHAQDLTPLVYMPGFLSDAESFRAEMARLAPRVVVGVGRRGIGMSSATQSGYSFAHQVADLEAVVEHANPAPFCAMAFSMGVPVILEYAVRHPQRIRGLVVLDYPARYPRPSQGWVEQVLESATGVPEHVVRALHREAEETILWDRITGFSAPTLVVRGGQEDARLTPEEAQRYLHLLPNARETVFEDAGHEVYEPDYERFMTTVEAFLAELDARG